MSDTVLSSPYVSPSESLRRLMLQVIIALIPCFAWSIYNTGFQHFDAVAALAGEGQGYTVGWLQGLLFGAGYVTLAEWWRLGAVISAVNLAIWFGIGGLWWKLIGLW